MSVIHRCDRCRRETTDFKMVQIVNQPLPPYAQAQPQEPTTELCNRCLDELKSWLMRTAEVA